MKSGNPPLSREGSPHNDREVLPDGIEPDDIDFTDVREQRGVILSILNDFLEDDTVGLLGRWIKHVGFDLRAIRYPADLPAAWVAHYRQGRGYDYERAFNDLVTWPPIAKQIAMPAEEKCDAECENDSQRAACE